MANPIELYCGATRLYRFNPSPTNISFNISKVGNMSFDIPGQIRPWMFDFSSQARTISLAATLVPTTRDNSYPGSGTLLDQIEDLTYIASCNWTRAGTEAFLRLYVPYPAALSSSSILSTYYTSADNTDYEQDQASIPFTTDVSGVSRSGYDKVYFVYPTDFTVTRDEASVNRVRVTMNFLEINESIKI